MSDSCLLWSAIARLQKQTGVETSISFQNCHTKSSNLCSHHKVFVTTHRAKRRCKYRALVTGSHAIMLLTRGRRQNTGDLVDSVSRESEGRGYGGQSPHPHASHEGQRPETGDLMDSPLSCFSSPNASHAGQRADTGDLVDSASCESGGPGVWGQSPHPHGSRASMLLTRAGATRQIRPLTPVLTRGQPGAEPDGRAGGQEREATC
jgi:hypothetical protein